MYVLDVLELKGSKRSWCAYSRVSGKVACEVHRFSGKVHTEFFSFIGVNEEVLMKILWGVQLPFRELFGTAHFGEYNKIDYCSFVLKLTLQVCDFSFALTFVCPSLNS